MSQSLKIRSISSLLLVLISVAQLVGAEPLHNVIDREIEKAAKGPLSPQADDAEFLRRVYLDLTGTLPTSAEARKFLADKDASKRVKLIDRLLNDARYARRMQEALTTMLLERRADTKVPDEQWKQYLRDALAKNRPWNEIVGELIFSEPGQDKKPKPQAKFLLVSGRADMHQKTQDVARLFLGRDIQCAQCHDHPTVDDFTQADYFGLFSYLQDVPEKAQAEFESVFEPGKRKTGPRLPGGKEVAIPKFEKNQQAEAQKHRPRLLLASDLPKASNKLFKQNAVNRIWFLLMGRGLVHPLNMQHTKNPSSHPKLFQAMADDFAATGFNVKRLIREIMLSKAYGRSSRLPEGVKPDKDLSATYRAAIPKPLSPEQMAWAVMQATGNLEIMQKAPVPEKSTFTYKDYINGRIDSAPNNFSDVMKLFVGVFGNPPGEPEIEFNPAMGHALFLMNERLILDWLKPNNAHSGNLVSRLLRLKDDEQAIEEIYLSVLTRLPTDEEQTEAISYLDQFKQRRTVALSELAWALISSSEFRCNH